MSSTFDHKIKAEVKINYNNNNTKMINQMDKPPDWLVLDRRITVLAASVVYTNYTPPPR